MYVLIVDDDSATAELTAECLQLDDIEAKTVANAADAAEECAIRLPDVLLLDIDLPDESGFDLGMRLRIRYPALRIVVFSGLSSSFGMDNLPPGMDAYLVKPVSIEVLLENIRQPVGIGLPAA